MPPCFAGFKHRKFMDMQHSEDFAGFAASLATDAFLLFRG
jgi:hypothetical protein